MSPLSRSLRELDCPARMFLACVAVTDDDLDRFGVSRRSSPGWSGSDTAARTQLHQLMASDPELSRDVARTLDLRHADVITFVRSLEPYDLALEISERARNASGSALAGWAWAVVTDPRPETAAMTKRLMADVYVRGIQLLTSDDLSPLQASSSRSERAR